MPGCKNVWAANDAAERLIAQSSETLLPWRTQNTDSCLQRNTCGTLTESSIANKSSLGFVRLPNENPKTLALLSALNSLILSLTGAYLFVLLLVILYGRSLSHAVLAHCPLSLPREKFVPMKKAGVTDTPHQQHRHHIARLILTSQKGFLQ